MRKLIAITVLLSIAKIVLSDTLPLPRFASIKSEEVNSRTGPGQKYPIEWVFIKKGEPVEIYSEFEQWRRIRDIYGDGGWVHVSMLSSQRYIIIKSSDKVNLYSKPSSSSSINAIIMPEVRCRFIKANKAWCNLQCDSYKGWVERKFVWGIYHNEFKN